MLFALFALLVLALSGTTRAQSQATIQACGNSIVLATYEDTVTYSTGDTGAFYNATYTYNPTYCNGIPIARIVLTDLISGSTYTCSAPAKFGTSGSLYTQCTESLGAMATAAQAGDTDCEPRSSYAQDTELTLRVDPASRWSQAHLVPAGKRVHGRRRA